jgi:hypothetical protein
MLTSGKVPTIMTFFPSKSNLQTNLEKFLCFTLYSLEIVQFHQMETVQFAVFEFLVDRHRPLPRPDRQCGQFKRMHIYDLDFVVGSGQLGNTILGGLKDALLQVGLLPVAFLEVGC